MSTTTAPAITTRGLSKRYGSRAAVEHLDLEVPTGVVAGFVGPNGAGKTTTMAMLLGLVRPTAGSGAVLGWPLADPSAYLGRVGALIEAPAFYPALTGRENLTVLAALGGHDPAQIPGLLDLVGLRTRGDDRFGRYSLGMKQRLGVAAALLGDPKLLILDEPSNGLDPAGISDMRTLLAEIAGHDRSVLVSSHILSELEQVCDWLIVIDRGTLVYQGPTTGFLGQAAPVLVMAPEHPHDLDRLAGVVGAGRVDVDRNGAATLVVPIDGEDPRTLAARLNQGAMAAGIVLAEVRLQRPTLESHYLAILEGDDR